MTQAKDAVITGSGAHTYRWIEDWAGALPNAKAAVSGWAHPGMAVTPAGEIVTCHPGLPLLLFFTSDGAVSRSVSIEAIEAHGIAAHGDVLLIADNGAKRLAGPGYPAHSAPGGGQVLELALDGTVRRRFGVPDHPAYQEGKFSPTSAAVSDDGDVWIADGYGQSLVHRYRGESLVQTLSGEEGTAGLFKTPHSVWIDRRAAKREAELYVADRTNARIQVYDLGGTFKRCIGPEMPGGPLITPTAFAAAGDLLFVAEFRGARVTVLDAEDRIVTILGANTEVVQLPGWPNRLDASGEPIRPADIGPGRFNGPHGIAADAEGNLYAAEWVIGGRYVKLVPT
jgi:DNA-binding beta-propeller fold protein YncE